jgi:sugar phosphate isomerase/epimerase
LRALEDYTLAVKQRVCPDGLFGIGLRLSDTASRQLSEGRALADFQRWLERNNSYVFTINGFPFGRFHGQRVKEQVYAPDWTTPERLEYTNRLFDLLASLLPSGVEGSVSTVPGSFKEFVTNPTQEWQIRSNIFRCVEHAAALAEKTGRVLHLGVEPEPLCLLETTVETVEFFDRIRSEHGDDPRISACLGVNYDTCHLAVEFEDPHQALANLQRNGIKISKVHLSSALKATPTPTVRAALAAFADDVYLHQVVARTGGGGMTRFRDLGDALRSADPFEQWRIHFHIPLQCPATERFDNTTDHLLGVLDVLAAQPGLCSHLEMETYTWEVLPAELKSRSVVDHLTAEYEWCLDQLGRRGLAVRK